MSNIINIFVTVSFFYLCIQVWALGKSLKNLESKINFINEPVKDELNSIDVIGSSDV